MQRFRSRTNVSMAGCRLFPTAGQSSAHTSGQAPAPPRTIPMPFCAVDEDLVDTGGQAPGSRASSSMSRVDNDQVARGCFFETEGCAGVAMRRCGASAVAEVPRVIVKHPPTAPDLDAHMFCGFFFLEASPTSHCNANSDPCNLQNTPQWKL